MNTINDYIYKLEKLSKDYQGILEQKELYNSILNELRELYRRQPKYFSDQIIAEINKLKFHIENRYVLKQGLKNGIKVRLLYIVKNRYRYSSVIALKKYISKYLNDHGEILASDIAPEVMIEYMYEYICSAIDEINDYKTKEVLIYNLKLIYKLIDDGVQLDSEEDLDNEYY